MELFVSMALVGALLAFIAAVLSGYRKTWETTWNGHRIKVINRAAREELWIDDELVHRNDSYGFAMQAVLNGTLDDPERGTVPVRARIHMDSGVTVGCELTIGGVVVPLQGEATQAAPLAEEQPADPRWEAASKLLAKVREESTAADERLVRVATDVQRALRRTLLALEHLDEAEEAHAVLGGDAASLVLVRQRWEGRADELVGAVRELHLAVVSRESPGGGGAVGHAEELLERLSAEAEVDAATLAGTEGLPSATLPVEEPEEEARERGAARREQSRQ